MEKSYFGIRISTYRRATGTFHLLARCLRSIISQTFSNWKVFLIGDSYQPHDEFIKLTQMLPSTKCYYENLLMSPERNKYSPSELWRVAGYTASCLGLSKIKEEGIPICVCLDDDDWFLPNHLDTLHKAYNDFPEAAFIYTQSTHKSPKDLLPSDCPSIHYNNKPPGAYGLIHSAASWDLRKIPLSYRNVIETHSPWVAGDADMWERIREYCNSTNLKTLYIPKLTVRHDYEHGTPAEPMVL